MSTVLSSSSSRAVWFALEMAFSHDSAEREFQLKDDLYALQRGSLAVVDYSRHFKNLCDKLAAIGRPIDEIDKSHRYLRGLGQSFASFSSSQMAIKPLPSFTALVPQAISHEIFQKSLASGNHTQAAFYAPTGRGSDGGRGNRHSGHQNNNGNGRGQNSNRGKGNSNANTPGRGNGRQYPPIQCQLCKMNGHPANRCQKLPEFAASFQNSAHLAEAFNTSCSLNNDDTSDWFVDIGASAHMTSSVSQVDHPEVYSESQDRTASGSRAT